MKRAGFAECREHVVGRGLRPGGLGRAKPPGSAHFAGRSPGPPAPLKGAGEAPLPPSFFKPTWIKSQQRSVAGVAFLRLYPKTQKAFKLSL